MITGRNKATKSIGDAPSNKSMSGPAENKGSTQVAKLKKQLKTNVFAKLDSLEKEGDINFSLAPALLCRLFDINLADSILLLAEWVESGDSKDGR